MAQASVQITLEVPKAKAAYFRKVFAAMELHEVGKANGKAPAVAEEPAAVYHPTLTRNGKPVRIVEAPLRETRKQKFDRIKRGEYTEFQIGIIEAYEEAVNDKRTAEELPSIHDLIEELRAESEKIHGKESKQAA